MKSDNIIIIGAGEAGRSILKELSTAPSHKKVIAFVDDDEKKIGTNIDGIKVFGSRSTLERLIKEFDISTAIIALPSARKAIIQETAGLLLEIDSNLTIQILPKIAKYFDAPIISELKEVTFSDIITREEATLDLESMNLFFHGKSVLITGAGGSIGSEIARQILRFNIKALICVGRGENSIYNLAKDLNSLDYKTDIQYRIMDVKDYALMNSLLGDFQIDIIFHAAAHKHVPLMEFNEVEALQNNVGGTLNVLKFALEKKAERFVLISTDKAVNPANVMGATKRLAEILTLFYNKNYGLKSSVVRFGNVLGSRGSVIPLFREQIKRGGPVTVTHPDMKRYFMSIPEASLLVINSSAYSTGGDIFILDMGEQYRILDIAEKLIRLYKKEPYRDIEIVFTGLRPGEKICEDLYNNNSKLFNTRNEKILRLEDNVNDYSNIINLLNILPTINKKTGSEIREIIKKIIPEYNYSVDLKQYFKKIVN